MFRILSKGYFLDIKKLHSKNRAFVGKGVEISRVCRLTSLSPLESPSEMGEGLICFSHSVGILPLLNGASLILGGSNKLDG